MDIDNQSKQPKKNKSRKVVCFDKEIVTKENAEAFLLSELVSEDNINKSNSLGIVNFKRKPEDETYNRTGFVSSLGKKSDTQYKKCKRKKSQTSKVTVTIQNSDNDIDSNSKAGKKLKKNKSETNEIAVCAENSDNHVSNSKTEKNMEKSEIISDTEELGESKNDEVTLENPKVTQEESIRARKRKKHAKLLEEKQLKTEIASQQNALNYLSLWKYNRTHWKFEKLKQIWLQHNLFDSSKIPDEFWGTVVEYFCGAKGSIRNIILKKAVDIIEKEEKSEEENTDEDYLLCLQRARDVVQNLQE